MGILQPNSYFFLWCQILFVSILSCPFANYEDGLLSALNPVSVENKILVLDSSDNTKAISFGYWSFCIPLWEVKRYPVVESEFDIQKQVSGQLFLYVQLPEKNEAIILGFLSFDQNNLQVVHNIAIKTQQSLQQFGFTYPAATYEGRWIFTLFTIVPNYLSIQMTDQAYQYLESDFSGIFEAQFTIGGRGQINMNSIFYNLNIFRGRLSKLIYVSQHQYDTNKFEELSNLCKIPQKIIGEQITYIVPGFRQFQGDILLQYVIDQVGNRYCLSGWVKYDVSSIIYLTKYTLLRLSAFKNYQSQVHFGDELFYLQVWLHAQFKWETLIIVRTNPYSIPLQGTLDYDSEAEIFYHTLYLYEYDIYEYLFNGLQKWHFVQYEYGRTGEGEEKFLFQIQFFNELGLITYPFGGPQRIASFTNSNFYLFFGGEDDALELLRASIYNFKFEHNYNDNKQFLLNVCHYSCQQCNGPLKNNCILCDPVSQRIFLNEQQICKCKSNYIDYDGNMICQPFSQEYQSIVESEIIAEFASKCQSGYFQINENQCIKCPQQNFNDKLCVDCLYYPLTWFQKPQCIQDLETRKEYTDDAYNLIQRNSIDYDLYIVDEAQNLILLDGVLDFCNDITQSYCHKTNYWHLGTQVNVICKENYYFHQLKCLKGDPQCLKVDQLGQCLQCLSGMYLRENHCFQCPLTCQTCKYDQYVVCESCFERFTVVNGQCIQCGSYCEVCKYFKDELLNISYIRCFKCVDDSKYMLSLDGQNCLQNPIANCIYAFQALHSDITVNSLDYYFMPQEESLQIVTYCGLCENNFMFVISTFECLKGFIVLCDFGYAQNPDFTSEEQFCLISQEEAKWNVQFNDKCQAESSNCGTCLLGKQNFLFKRWTCLICSAGYYSERLSGKCYKCPEELHCYQCIQQDSFLKDRWKDNVRAFYRQFIEGEYTHPFIMYGQSQNPQDYEVICTMCQPNYQFLGDVCILSCPESCLECRIVNGQNICVKCQLEENGRRLSIVNNQCIQCPINCALCRFRSTDEIKNINPLFSNAEFQLYTYQCLKSFDNFDYYYDQEIGQFIECSEILNGCQKQFIIPIQLYCSQEDYNIAFSQQNSEYEKTQFKRKNILIKDLFSGNNFAEFYNNEFYLMANEKQIKKIIIKIEGYGQQSCQISGASVITQEFSVNIFSAIDVELQMIFLENTIFIYDKSISFLNFKMVSISGLTLQPKFNDMIKQVIFTSPWPLTVQLNNIIYKQEGDQQDQSQIIFYDLKSLLVKNLQLLNLIQNKMSNFFKIEKTSFQKNILFNSLKIHNCYMSNQIIFLFHLGLDDTLIFLNTEIQSIFINSSLISTLDSIQMASLKLSQLNLLVQLQDCQQFFDIYRFKTLMISSLKLVNSTISNTTFLNLNNEATLSDISFYDSQFKLNSSLIMNSGLLLENSFQITMKNMKFKTNIYDETTKFIEFLKFNSENSVIEISQFYLLGNSAINISDQFNSDQINSALVYIQSSFISINEMEIQRGYGLMDISIAQAQKLTLEQIKITQHKNFSFLGLHQYLDCQRKQVKGQSYWQSLYIFSTKQIEIKELLIIQAQIFNQPLIFIQSADLGIIQQKESIKLSNIIIKSNLLLLTGLTKQTTLFKFQSSQDINLIINNAKFQDNILHEYVQNQVTDSATILLIDFTKGFAGIHDSLFYNNLVTNSSDSILHIRSDQIVIENCEFLNNSIFQYETLSPYLLWGYPNSQLIYQSNIEYIFPVQSKSGNGILTGKMIEITSTSVIKSSGSFGGGFQITAQNWASVTFENCVFQDIHSLFNSQDESGGVIYFDGSNSQSFNFNMMNLTASNINCRYKGGLLYISAGLSKANIQLKGIKTNDVYSSIGSILFIEFSNLAISQQKLNVIGLQIINSIKGQINFLNQFTNIFSQEWSILINNRSAIYVDSGSELIFKDIIIHNMLIESAFYLSNALKISISQFEITNSSLNKNLVDITANKLSKSYYIISQFTVVNNQVGKQFIFTKCLNASNQNKYINFQCLLNEQETPKQLETQNIQINDICVINNMNIQQDLTNSGLIVFGDLNILSQLQLIELNLKNIDCQNCEQGLISGVYQQTESNIPRIILESIIISQSKCGKKSCVIISNGQLLTRMLQQNLIYQLGYELIINHYDCINNTAVNGTCLMISNLKTLISKSNFKGNNATLSGGSLYVMGSKLIVIEESLIQNNYAYQGGGYFTDQLISNQTNLKTTIEGNKATFYGDDQVSSPTQMTISFNGTIFSTYPQQKTDQLSIDQVQIGSFTIINYQTEGVLYLPTGQQINIYQYYDWKKSTYIPLNLQLRLLALNQQKIVQKNLFNSICSIQSRFHNIKNNSDEPFLNKYTNTKQISFNDTTQDYNLDNLIIYFDSETPQDIVLQLQFSCNSIKIPIYNMFPQNVSNYHQNYFLRLNIRSFACQLGEIKQNDSCVLCDSSQGLFSVESNAQKCSVLDDVSTISVKPAKLNIKNGYWRSFVDISEVSYCFNLPLNCLGGWVEGDTSCYTGHIGALCEQCDLYNTRGSGSYSVGTNYSCGTCDDMIKNVVLIGVISIWTLITILISVKSTLKAIKEFIRIVTLSRLGIVISQDITSPAILIKMLTNFLQIVAAISTFQLSIPVAIDDTIKAVGNPIQPMAYSLDCLLISMFNSEIHYARMIWQLILPFIYIQLFLFFYYIGVKAKLLEYNSSVLTTTFIYIYIYLQPNLVGGLVQLISFRKISGFQWIQANVSYKYNTSYHFLWILEFCLPALIIIAFLIPLYMFTGLYIRRKRLQKKVTRLHWGYLYNEYKKEAYFWEIVKIFEKELIIFFLTYYQDSIVIKSMLIQIVLLIYFQLNKKYQPYSNKNLNNLDGQSAQICMISIALGVGIYMSQLQGQREIQIPFFLILSIINILFLLAIFSKIIMEYIRDYKNRHQNQIDAFRAKIKNKIPFLQYIPFCKKILASRVEQRNRVAKLYQKLKQFLLPQAKQILAFREYQWENAIIQNMEDPFTHKSSQESTERQKFLYNNQRLSTLINPKKKNTSNFILEKNFDKIVTKTTFLEAEEKKKLNKQPQPYDIQFNMFKNQNSSQN